MYLSVRGKGLMDMSIDESILYNNVEVLISELESSYALLLLQFKSSNILKSSVKCGSDSLLGSVGYSFHNCTIITDQASSKCNFDQAMYLCNSMYAYVTHSRFILSPGTSSQKAKLAIHIIGQIRFLNTSFQCTYLGRYHCTKLKIENTVFSVSSHLIVNDLSPSAVILTESIHVEIYNCQFLLTEDSEETGRGGLLYIDISDSFDFNASNVIFNTTLAPVNSGIMLIRGNRTSFKDVSIFCPSAFKTVEMRLGNEEQIQLDYNCILACEEAYPTVGGKVILAGNIVHSKSLIKHHEEPICSTCPVGANCGKTLKALPNYWGYKVKYGILKMLRCPEGYCCQDDETCKGIDSCSSNRTGMLCGSCISNWTVSLFLSSCILAKNCNAKLIIFLYILAVIVYTTVLVTFDNIKNKCIRVTKGIFKNLKNKFKGKSKQPRNKQKDDEKEEEGSKDNTDDMKYIQILFYYVQDASLFKIQVPGKDLTDESIVIKILKFSPEALITLYNRVVNICFIEASTTVTKVLFKIFFGPCVMFFLLIIYAIQEPLSRYMISHLRTFQSLRSSLMRAFLLVVLFSYQQIVIGAFQLVQCVEIGDGKVLYIQSDIACNWQYPMKFYIEIYICTTIVPIFFVLSHAALYVKDKNMSIMTFVMACIFPLPAILIFHCWKFIRLKMSTISCVISSRYLSSHCSLESNIEMRDIHTSSNEPNSDTDTSYLTANETVDSKSSTSILEVSPRNVSYTEVGSLEVSFSEVSPTEVSPTEGNLSEVSLDEVNQLDIGQQSTAQGNSTSEEEPVTSCREEIAKTLLQHYKTIKIFGFRLTWLSIHKLYRLLLVVSNTYIVDPTSRIYLMTFGLMFITSLNIIVKPYKDSKTNITSSVSYLANLCIAFISAGKAGLIYYGCQFNCNRQEIYLDYMDWLENILLVYFPVSALFIWIFSAAIKKCTGHKKKD